ncbi:unnamed protein product [Effrenium voratum]|nr:unnamed protein product [Effrenium voratum]
MTSTGTCKSFNVAKGFGFITMADGTDIFVHAKFCTDGGIPKQGDILSFTMEPSQTKPGQMQAGNVTGGTGVAGPGGKGLQGSGSMQGTCKSFNPEKGFGFITGADGNDVFVHRSGMVDGSTPQAGDTITFDVEPSKQKPDQMQAVNATGGTGYDTGKAGGKGWGMGGMDFWGGGYDASKGGWGASKGGPYGCGGKGKGGAWGGWGGRDVDEMGVVQREESLSKVIYELCGALQALQRLSSLRGVLDYAASTAAAVQSTEQEVQLSLQQLLITFEHFGLQQVKLPPLYKRMLEDLAPLLRG